MNVGSSFIAPEGLGSLVKDQTYFFLSNKNGRAVLASFNAVGEPRAYLVQMLSEDFENALLTEKLFRTQTQHSLPPWLRQKEGRNLFDDDAGRRSHKETYPTRVNRRYAHIHNLVERADEVLCGDSPQKRIAEHAASCTPPQNPTRLTAWFVAYIAFGRNRWALLPPFHRIGVWSRRKSRHCNEKMGRPAKYSGKRNGYSAIKLVDAIVNAYRKHAELGVCMTSIYKRAMKEDFKCKVAVNEHGDKYFYHPESKPFPSYWQFRYWVIKEFGLTEVQRTLYGDARMRLKSPTSEGTFAESVSNILERTEGDAYQVKERPLHVNSNEPAPVLKVAREVCVASGRVVGVGSCLGAERTVAYRTMLFSMVVPGSVLGRLLGLTLTDEQWPGIGLSPHLILDRGPGAAKTLIENCERKFPIRELAPSYQGQSKANVESSHPRSIHSEGAPTHKISHLNYQRMMQREFMLAIQDNETSDVASRLTPDMAARGVRATPNGIWSDLAKRGRTSAVPVAFADAVRTFLTPVEFDAAPDGLVCRSVRFDSQELRSTGILGRLALHRRFKIEGYMHPNSTRYAWVEIKGQLVEVAAMLPLREDEAQLYISIDELEKHWARVRELKGIHREHKLAAAVQIEQQFEETTGERWNGGTRKRGRAPKRNADGKPNLKVIQGGRGLEKST